MLTGCSSADLISRPAQLVTDACFAASCTRLSSENPLPYVSIAAMRHRPLIVPLLEFPTAGSCLFKRFPHVLILTVPGTCIVRLARHTSQRSEQGQDVV